MTTWKQWAAVAVVTVLLAGGVARAVHTRQQQQATVAAAAQAKPANAVELAHSDVVLAQTRNLAQGLPISGALKAANSAVVKARVAGELQGLRVREGDSVQAGQVLARIAPTEVQARLQQALEQAGAAKAQIDIAQRQFANNQALVDQGFISKTALDASQATLNAAQSTHRAALAAAAVARQTVDDAVLRAPISGLIAQRLAQPGERVALDTRVLEIVDIRRMELEASVSAADAVALRVGQKAQLHIEGSASDTQIAATVVRINPSTQAGSRSVLVYLAVDAVPGLRQGLFAEGTLGTGQTSALAMPVSALRTDKPLPYVQVVENHRVVHKTVVPGLRGQVGTETMVAVTGLADGAQVIQGSLGSLAEGTAVTFTAAH
ncbi:efflux RND transporter periplasmic adaptor subunit [Rhodoferax sp.]|uniref:efflux RND transporter periplasmic adaptor subunit n=1 Tax=Rhodoferax sp. TaxID=50421 RepID=UPI0025F758AC|nr:efflux RND transporter periplasmic adaptor subunit [Rhodoferax sp.]